MLDQIIEPTLLLDEKICRNNIKRMAQKAQANNLVLRPHFKTHQSLEVGRWFKDYGIDRITTSSIRMAAYFAPEWNDITVAFPVNIREMRRINELASKIQLNLVIENETGIQTLSSNLQHPVNVFIKADTGYHRTGINPERIDLLNSLLDQIEASPKLHFKGFLGHAGHSYGARGKDQIASIHQSSIANMQQFSAPFQERFPDLILSYGDTPTCSTMPNFEGMHEIRPGNFVFYDVTQVHIGSCQVQDIAVAMACPVVAKHPDRNEIILYGGGVHLSKDRYPQPDGSNYYGLVVQLTEEGWSGPLPDTFVKSLSQEHGVLKVTPALMEATQIGDLLGVLPIHSCMTADLMKRYHTFENKWIDMMHYV